jgi:hypothetical protein
MSVTVSSTPIVSLPCARDPAWTTQAMAPPAECESTPAPAAVNSLPVSWSKQRICGGLVVELPERVAQATVEPVMSGAPTPAPTRSAGRIRLRRRVVRS